MVAVALAMVPIIATAVAQALLKHGIDQVGGISPPGSQFLVSMKNIITEPYIVGGLLLIVLAVPLWLEVLSRLPLSIAYPLVSIGYVISLGIGAFVLNESVGPLRIGGVGLIILGVIAVSRSQ